MTIKQVRIFNYGKWHRATIPFKAGLNILYGRNEAGKTTLISFIKGVLFGYLQRQSSHKNYIPRNSKNYGGQLDVISNGHEYIVQRMAGKKGGLLTVMDTQGNRLENSVLSKILGPFNRETYDALYYFGTVDLQKMGKLKQRDLIYRIQRIGLTHSDEWIDYRDKLNKRAKKLYSPRGYKPPLNQMLKQYSGLLDRVKTAKSGYHDYQELLSDLNQFKSRKTALDRQIKQTDSKAVRLEHYQNGWQRYQKMLKLRATVQKPTRKGFSERDAKTLTALNQRLIDNQNQYRLNREQVHELARQITHSDSVREYRTHRSTVDSLSYRLNDMQYLIHRTKLLKDRYKDFNHQLKVLRKHYAINGQTLEPMDKMDLARVQKAHSKYLSNQKWLKKLNLKSNSGTKGRFLKPKQCVIIAISILFIVIGIMIKLWLLDGLGVMILILGLGLSKYQDHQKLRRKLQSEINRFRTIDKRITGQIEAVRSKYNYPNSTVESWVACQDNLRRLKNLNVKIQVFDSQIRKNETLIKKYFDQWSFISQVMTLDHDDVNRIVQLKNYVNKIHHIFKNNLQVQKQSYAYKKHLDDDLKHQKAIRAQLSEFYHDRQIKNADEFKTVQRQQTKLKQQRTDYQDLSKQIGPDEIAKFKQYGSLDSLKTDFNETDHNLTHLKNRSQQVDDKLTSTEVKLHQIVHNGSYDELQQRAANYRTQINELAGRWLEISLAGQWINATLNLATKGRVPKIEHQAQLNFKILTNGRYSSIVFNKSGIKVLRNDKRRFTLYELSKGTVQQLYLALIFAMAQVFNNDYPMPVLIDDGFTDFDVNRKRAAVKLLKSISQKLQVIYCTSDDRLMNHGVTLDLSKIK